MTLDYGVEIVEWRNSGCNPFLPFISADRELQIAAKNDGLSTDDPHQHL